MKSKAPSGSDAGDTAGPANANSICVFSGLNDDPGAPLDGSGPNGPGGVSQSYGQENKLGLVDPKRSILATRARVEQLRPAKVVVDRKFSTR